jgi:hypothetical protein
MKSITPKLFTLLALTVLSIILDGCGSQNKFASSFGKRKYNKGYYWNLPRATAQSDIKQIETKERPKAKNQAKIAVNMYTKPIIHNVPIPTIPKITIASKQHTSASKSTLKNSLTTLKTKPTLNCIHAINSHHHEENNPKDNGWAIAAFITGIFLNFLGLPLILGLIGLNQINNHPEDYKDKWMAYVGIVLGVIGIIAEIYVFVLLFTGSLI